MGRYRRWNCRRHIINGSIKKILGIVLAVLGVIIIIQIIPLKAWIFAIGILLICLGWSLFRIF
ncbi:Exopolysaccharide synthesis, ExoD [Proteiniborus ethanoligenes]|uniref:Exopolysaccharide synthesis, ExoD n=1 Tax=Proteiniborus ethanoligenes TaxID=415015 RepID=A0A1H3PLC9_9FIRM|nr:exopolysaccharide biosynthesis protein [Proteiniborus ethanoligenes]TAH64058.1 MAG: hypothetical protein EWM50_00390 [Gottschalkiaceae bacterium]SDZ01788.1 Exopolysaccharide synthesis, ExoD [Proteiniborus ethanoligenes]